MMACKIIQRSYGLIRCEPKSLLKNLDNNFSLFDLLVYCQMLQELTKLLKIWVKKMNDGQKYTNIYWTVILVLISGIYVYTNETKKVGCKVWLM